MLSNTKIAQYWYNHAYKKGVNYMSKLTEKIVAVKERLKHEYMADSRPWVVTFSGGKDSTTVLQLVAEMLLDLRKENRDTKKVYR